MEVSSNGEVVITFSKQEALVLLDWLARSNQGSSVAPEAAEQRILNDLEACFEKVLVEPFQSNYNELLQAARQAICDGSEAKNT